MQSYFKQRFGLTFSFQFSRHVDQTLYIKPDGLLPKRERGSPEALH